MTPATATPSVTITQTRRFRDLLVAGCAARGIALETERAVADRRPLSNLRGPIARLDADPAGRRALDAALEEAFVATAVDDPAAAYQLLGEVASALEDSDAPRVRMMQACAHEGEIEAARWLAQHWEMLSRVLAPRHLWSVALSEFAADTLATLAADCCTGDARAWAHVRTNRSWHTVEPLVARSPQGEWRLLRAAIRGWASDPAFADSPAARISVRVAYPATLDTVARCGPTPPALELHTGPRHTTLTATAALVVEGRPLELSATCCAPDAVARRGEVAGMRWARAVAVGAPFIHPDGPHVVLGVKACADVAGLGGQAAPATMPTPSRQRCRHPSADWRPNLTWTAIGCSCPDCDEPMLALAWRDELPLGHPQALEAGSEDASHCAAVRDLLGTIAPVAPRRGRRWDALELLCVGQTPAPTAPAPHRASTEAMLAGRRRRASGAAGARR